MLNPWLILGFLAALAGAFVAGIRVESNHRDAAELTAERAQGTAYRQGVAKAQALGLKLGRRQAKTKVVYQTIREAAVEAAKNPDYANVCLPDDGLRIANDALSRSTRAGQRDPAVPSAAETEVR